MTRRKMRSMSGVTLLPFPSITTLGLPSLAWFGFLRLPRAPELT